MAIEIGGVLLYSVPELSEKINVTPVTIRNYLKRGRLQGRKVMGRWFILEDDVVKLFQIERRKVYEKSECTF